MFEHFFGWGGLSGTSACGRQRRSKPTDQPLALLVTTPEVVRELRARADCPYHFGDRPDPATGIDEHLLDAVRQARHPVDLLRRLEEWADDVQRAVPQGRVAACWHPAVTPDLLRQATRYPVRVVAAGSADEAVAAAPQFAPASTMAPLVPEPTAA